eukprot:2811320-Lingulodinium_polyedra.AAC.1
MWTYVCMYTLATLPQPWRMYITPAHLWAAARLGRMLRRASTIPFVDRRRTPASYVAARLAFHA